MQLTRRLALGATAVLATLASYALAAIALQGSTWSITYDDPNKSGQQKTTVKISYIDAQGVKQEKLITATTDIDQSMDQDQKKAACQGTLNAEINKPANQVGGTSLASTGGTGNITTLTPTGNFPGQAFSDAKIEKVTTDDTGTNEKDKVGKPGPNTAALAEIEAVGDITGQSLSGSSVFSFRTNIGYATIPLSAGMRKRALMDLARAALQAQGATTWIEPDRVSVILLLENDKVDTIGVGTDDRGLTARLSVLAN